MHNPPCFVTLHLSQADAPVGLLLQSVSALFSRLPIIFIGLLVKRVIYSQTSCEHKKRVKHSQLLTARSKLFHQQNFVFLLFSAFS